jgi:condensin complex subunit 3
MLAHPELPPGLIEPALDVLSEIMPTERELIRVVVEIIIELREDDNGDNELQSVLVMSISFFCMHMLMVRS